MLCSAIFQLVMQFVENMLSICLKMGHKVDIMVYQKGLIFGMAKNDKEVREINHKLNISTGVMSKKNLKKIKQCEPTSDTTSSHFRCGRKINITMEFLRCSYFFCT